jgi:pre-mRNA-processing factor 6
MELEEEDRYETWVADVQSLLDRSKIGTARAVLAYALRVYPDRPSLWRSAADLEKVHGTPSSLDSILEQATKCVPQAEVLWLMRAKERWVRGDVGGAREVLVRAFDTNPESEQIWLAAVKLEATNGELGVARELLGRARAVAGTQRVSFSPSFLLCRLDRSVRFGSTPGRSSVWRVRRLDMFSTRYSHKY